MTPADVDRLVEELAPHVVAGRLVLFTGAGFASDGHSVAGDPLPTTTLLRDLLWPIAFHEDTPDDSRLEDVYECAIAADRDATGRLLRSCLVVDADSLPESYRTWLSMPWSRMYTLNVDDLDEAASRRWALPVPVLALSALHDGLPPRSEELLSIHLNGRIADFPELTFSQLQYGHRMAVPDPWYQHLVADLRERPVVFVGTTLDEPPLWQQVALRLRDGAKTAGRHRSYLVTRRMSRARQEVLDRLNVEWVPMNSSDFAERVLTQLDEAGAEGHRRLAARAGEGQQECRRDDTC